LFDGAELSVTFVRTALGPNAGTGLEVVRIGETTDRQGLATVRTRAPFRPLHPASSLSEQIHFGEPVLLLRAPFRLSFAYAGADRVWQSDWHHSDKLPAAIKLTVRDAASERVLSISTVATVHVQSPAQVECTQPDGCDGKSVSDGSQEKPGGNLQAGTAGQGGSR
jgi:general secretion pathway protein J